MAQGTATAEALPRQTSVIYSQWRVDRYQIIGTQTWMYSAWERVSAPIAGRYSTISCDDSGQWWGRKGTECLPQWIEALPAHSDERSRRVRMWINSRYSDAYSIIAFAYPETKIRDGFVGGCADGMVTRTFGAGEQD